MDHHGHSIHGHNILSSASSLVHPENGRMEPQVTQYVDQKYVVPQSNHLEVNHTYDPNLSSAARYSPPHYGTISSIDLEKQLQDIVQSSVVVGEEYHIDPNAITYNNVIFVPNHSESDQNSLIDTNQAYVLSSDSRFFGSYMRECADDDGGIVNRTSTDQTNGLEYHGYQIQTETGEYIETITGCEKQEIVDMETGDTQIIIQGTNGQFYRQIHHNIYVNDGDGVIGPPVNAVEVLNHESIVTNYDQNLFQSSYEDPAGHMNMKTNEVQANDHPMDGFSIMPTMADAELLINSASYGGYKHDYAGLGNDGLLAAHHLIDLGGDFNGSGNEVVRSSIADELAFIERQHERNLLESTMSPLLAAVNDITSRDEHLQQYLGQTAQKEIHHHHQPSASHSSYHLIQTNDTDSFSSCSVQPSVNKSIQFKHILHSHQQSFPHPNNVNAETRPEQPNSDEYVDINEMEFFDNRQNTHRSIPSETGSDHLLVRRSQRKIRKQDELTISDKHDTCRAWTSLPNSIFYIGIPFDQSSEHCVFAKKDIPLRTRFGPIEGDIKCLLPSELAMMRNDHYRLLPALFVDNIRLVDISNEYTSNWMRFVRLAHSFSEQNMLLEESDDHCLFFRSCQLIAPRQEIKVGYSQEYAIRYGLRFIEPSPIETKDRWPCLECDGRFESFALLQTHLSRHEEAKQIRVKSQKQSSSSGRKRRRANRTRLTTRKVSGPTVRYACCFCSQVFSTLVAFKKHNEAEHDKMESGSRVGMGANSTTVLQNSNKENRPTSNRCHQCRRSFPSAERFEKHRRMHCISYATKMIQCNSCPKKLFTHSAMAMHVKSHQNKSRYFHCVFCSERFQQATDMMDHVPQHLDDGFYKCSKCSKAFIKYADLRKHVRAIHSGVSHPCPDCDKKFKSPDKLRQHRLCHSGYRAFACTQCDAKYKRKDKLREHIINKHSKKKSSETKNETKATIVAKTTNETNKTTTTNAPTSLHSKPSPKTPKKKVRHKTQKTITGAGAKKESPKCSSGLVETHIKCAGAGAKKESSKCTSGLVETHIKPALENTEVLLEQKNTVIFPSDPSPEYVVQSVANADVHANTYLTDQSYAEHIIPCNVPQPSEQSSYYDLPLETHVPESIDYQQFIYKCHVCRLGFKRRGMLVNHLAKLHPRLNIDTVPELNLPILKAQRFYYCAYCDKVYKSNSKRKLHILKNHPGLELPVSCKVIGATVQTEHGIPNASFSEPVGNVSALPQHCSWCHKQYASKGRLLCHLRKAHPEQLAVAPEMDEDFNEQNINTMSANNLEPMSLSLPYKSDLATYMYEHQVHSDYTEHEYHPHQQEDIQNSHPEQFGDYLEDDQQIMYHPNMAL